MRTVRLFSGKKQTSTFNFVELCTVLVELKGVKLYDGEVSIFYLLTPAYR